MPVGSPETPPAGCPARGDTGAWSSPPCGRAPPSRRGSSNTGISRYPGFMIFHEPPEGNCPRSPEGPTHPEGPVHPEGADAPREADAKSFLGGVAVARWACPRGGGGALGVPSQDGALGMPPWACPGMPIPEARLGLSGGQRSRGPTQPQRGLLSLGLWHWS